MADRGRAMLPKIVQTDQMAAKKAFRNKLMRREAKIGGKLFGPVPKGHRREFFRLDSHTWVWHEEWLDQDGHPRAVTTRYDVRPDGILKVQDNGQYKRMSRDETRNLYHATQMYRQKVGAYYQRLLQTA